MMRTAASWNFPLSSATVELAAEAVGCEPARIAKTLSFRTNDGVILIVAAGDAKINNPKYKARFGCKARMLAFEGGRAEIGHAVGGVCPFGVNEGVTVFLDESLRRFETVFPACGSSNSAIELTIRSLKNIPASKAWVDVCKGWRERMRIAVAQIGSGENKEMNRYMIERLAWSASEAGADMLFLPDHMRCSVQEATARRATWRLRSHSTTRSSPRSASLQQVRVSGSAPACTSRPMACRTTRSSSLMMRGGCAARTAKTAFMMLSAIASRRSAGQGEQPFEPVETRPAGSGIITCYELRFPELAAEQKKRGQKCFCTGRLGLRQNKPLHWNTLLCARAIENGVTVIGADQYRADHFIGHSAVFAPDGTTLASLGAGEGLLVTEIAGTEEEEEERRRNEIRSTLYVITDGTYTRPKPLLHAVEESAGGGATLIQLREKETGGRAYLELAQQVKAVRTAFRSRSSLTTV